MGIRSCKVAIQLWHIIRRDPLTGGFLMILQVAKLDPVSRAAGMDCEYPLDKACHVHEKGDVL